MENNKNNILDLLMTVPILFISLQISSELLWVHSRKSFITGFKLAIPIKEKNAKSSSLVNLLDGCIMVLLRLGKNRVDFKCQRSMLHQEFLTLGFPAKTCPCKVF